VVLLVVAVVLSRAIDSDGEATCSADGDART
jgi:hypothetical protein